MNKLLRLSLLMLLSLTLLTVACAAETGAEDNGCVRLIALNIGKADCLLLLNGPDAYLIDTGYEQNYPALQAMLSYYGVSRLRGVFLTHCHQDHMGGLAPLSQSDIAVDAWYAADRYLVKTKKHPQVKAAASRGQSVSWLAAGDEIAASQDAFFTVLGPVFEDERTENNNSLVLHFSSPHGSILLCGDMKEDEEDSLLEDVSPCDVIKIAHHGGKNAAGARLLQRAQPRIALICTDTAERADTPSPEVLRRLAAMNCAVYVTQNTADALEITLQNGQAAVRDVAWPDAPARAQGIEMRINLADDTLTLKNNAATALTLTGWQIYSTKGNELFILPQLTLAPGEAYEIGSRATPHASDAIWDEKRVWHATEYDLAILYDALGRPVARTDNGIPE